MTDPTDEPFPARATAAAAMRGAGLVRGMHYMTWHRDQWNYHPSLPSKRIGQIDDIDAVGGTVLLWSCMGSGGIGLPYLDRELHEAVPGRLRFYGHLNDAEFAAECARRGVLAFAVVWNAQLWEFPAEFNDARDALLSLNIPRGVGVPGWLGLSELSRDVYPALYAPMDDFVPRLRDRDGAPIPDYLVEFRQRTLHDGDVLSSWLMAPGHDHRCHAPCGSDRAYVAYVKRQIKMMIDAGAGGIMIDEPDAMNVGLRMGGCFCRDCIAGFRDWLAANPRAGTAHVDLDTFDWRATLLEQGYTDADVARSVNERRWTVPFQRLYAEYADAIGVANLAEVADHARAYSTAARGVAVPVSANVYNYLPRWRRTDGTSTS